MDHDSYLSFEVLQGLARRSDQISASCTCGGPALDAWTSFPVHFPEHQLKPIGTLIRDVYSEPTFEQFQLDGTNIWSVDAPIAPRFYPSNRCTVWECDLCHRVYLRYVEGGGYFVDSRIRRLRLCVLVDPAP